MVSALPRPQVGLDTSIVMDHAVVDLADRRFVRTLDRPAQLHLLASLVADAKLWVTEPVGAAGEAGAPCPWSDASSPSVPRTPRSATRR